MLYKNVTKCGVKPSFKNLSATFVFSDEEKYSWGEHFVGSSGLASPSQAGFMMGTSKSSMVCHVTHCLTLNSEEGVGGGRGLTYRYISHAALGHVLGGFRFPLYSAVTL